MLSASYYSLNTFKYSYRLFINLLSYIKGLKRKRLATACLLPLFDQYLLYAAVFCVLFVSVLPTSSTLRAFIFSYRRFAATCLLSFLSSLSSCISLSFIIITLRDRNHRAYRTRLSFVFAEGVLNYTIITCLTDLRITSASPASYMLLAGTFYPVRPSIRSIENC